MERESEDNEAPPVASATAGGTGSEKEEERPSGSASSPARISLPAGQIRCFSSGNSMILERLRFLQILQRFPVFLKLIRRPSTWDGKSSWTGGCEYNELRDVFIFVESESDIIIQELKSSDYIDSRGEPKRLGEILVDSGILDPKELKSLLESQKLIGQRIEDAGLADKSEIESALHVQEHFKKSRTQNQTQQVSNTLRVSSQRLDQLIDLVGELVYRTGTAWTDIGPDGGRKSSDRQRRAGTSDRRSAGQCHEPADAAYWEYLQPVQAYGPGPFGGSWKRD